MRNFTTHFLAFLLIFHFSTNAQVIFSDDFTTIDQWTLIDSDGDGNDWELIDFGGTQGSVAYSKSYDNELGVLTPDNWMVSSAIDLSSSTSNPSLFWKVMAQDQDWADEYYSVYVASSPDVSYLESSSVSFSETVGASSGYLNRVLDLSSFMGESSVYIAFRHHNCTDMFYLNIDDVFVREVSGENAIVTSESSAIQYATSPTDPVNFMFDVTSFSEGDLSGYEFHYSVDGAASSVSGSGALSLGESETFSVGLGVGEYSVSVEVVNSSGELISETTQYNLSVVPPVPNFTMTDSDGVGHDLHEYLSRGNVVLLDFMASWCSPCAESTPEINTLWEEFGSGNSSFQVFAMSTDPSDNNYVMNTLGWGGNYPKIAWDPIIGDYFDLNPQGDEFFYHYGNMVGEAGGVPLFVMICPNEANPAFSDVSYSAGGWYTQPGLSISEIRNALLDCVPSILSFENDLKDGQHLVNIYPNPSQTNSTIEINPSETVEVDIEVINSLGQKVFTYSSEMNVGKNFIDIPLELLSQGVYNVHVRVGSDIITESLSIIK